MFRMFIVAKDDEKNRRILASCSFVWTPNIKPSKVGKKH